MSTHEQIKELLTDYALRELTEQKSSEVKTHLADCQECRTELKKLQAVLECADSMRELSADEQAVESAKESLLKAVANEEKKEPTSRPTIRLDLIWSTIMKSRLTKLAAAVIIIAVLAGLPFFGGKKSGIALAQVLEKIEQTRAYMYTMEMKITGSMLPSAQEQTTTTIVSDDYGMKSYLEQTDPNTGKTTTQEVYILPEQKMIVTIMLEKKQYMRMPFGDELLAMMKQQNNDPREIIKQIMACEYTELGRSVIDGVEVEGFRTTDPAFLSALDGDTTSTELTLWVDAENWLPFRSEMDIKHGEKMQITGATYDYRWNVPVQASDFDPVIPEDFKPFPTDGMKVPGMTEADGIEGLKLFAEITGRYPKKLNMMDLGQEIAALATDFQNLPQLIEKLDELKKMSQNSEISEDQIRDTILKTTMEIMRPLQSIGFFHMTLVADKKEPVYYGDKVTPEFTHAVLMRWKAEDGNYRVIFGDLTIEDVTADELAELEAAPLNNKPIAIRPQPADGTVSTELKGLKLSWMPGAYVNEHKVYFGTATDQMLLLAEVADSCSVMAPALERATTYYWCVDEVQPDGSVAAGDVWSFNTGGLVAWWKLDEGSGNTAADSGDKGLDGTLVGDTSWVDGIVDGALVFDGDGDYVDLGKAPAFDITRQITVSAWVKVNAFNRKWQAIVAKGDSAWRLQRNSNNNTLEFACSGLVVPGTSWGDIHGTFDVNDGRWHHAVGTYDGSKICLYVDGKLDASSTASGTININNQPVYIGENTERPNRFWNGLIDDVLLYSYALGADEVAALYEDSLAASAEKAGEKER